MKPALTRDERIELMRTSKERMETRVSNWLKDSQVRASVRRTADNRTDGEFTVTQTSIRRCV